MTAKGQDVHHGNDSSNRDERFKLKIRHVVLAVFVALLGAAILYVGIISSGANRRLEALRAAGQPTTFAELALLNKLPMGVENAAPVYERAFAAFVPPQDSNLPYVGKAGYTPERGVVLPEPTTRAIADCLAANTPCLALLHEAAGIATCRYDYDYTKGFPDLSSVRSCARLLMLAAISNAVAGDADGAIARIQDGLRLADSLEKEPFLIAHLIRLAGTGIAITGLERTLSATTFTDQQLKDLDEAVALTAGKLDLAQVFVTERCFMIESVRNPALMGAGGAQTRVLTLPGLRSQGLVDILDYMGACVEAASLPHTQRGARFREIGTKMDNLSMLHIAVKMLAPALTRIADLDSRTCAHLDLARTALAMERYRLAQGRPPEQLADLVPDYLQQVPIDPFDGQPIRYRRTEPGYILYSIMEDGQDNGGKEKEQVGKGQPHDLCFIVTR
ncbi:MAG: hypothetical protein ABFE13_04055 [Phycisphaerales bacterium]